jgi:hypothetical protein
MWMAGSSGGDGDVPSPRPPAGFHWTDTVTCGAPDGDGGGEPGPAAATRAVPPDAGSGDTAPVAQPARQPVFQPVRRPERQTVQQVVRHGPGVPVTVPAARTVPTAEQVWRDGLPAAAPAPAARARWRVRQIVGTAVSVALLAASGVVIFLRLYHGPFGVTGVAVTQQAKAGCTVDVTGRIDTSGAAGTVSYQWVFQPQFAEPRPVSQSVAAGQSAVYVTAAVEGHGHGSLAQTVTLQVLGPGPGRAARARVVIHC